MLLPGYVFFLILLSALTPWLYRWLRGRTGTLLGLLILLSAVMLWGWWLPSNIQHQTLHTSFDWATQLGVAFSFHLDGLSYLMAVLITGIGGLIIMYGGAYLANHPSLPRFLTIVLLFMSAMLGVVLSGNALLLFLFWELTSITSFLLIGFDHDRPNARAGAWQALLVTASGGLAMLAGFALLYITSNTFEIQTWLQHAQDIQQHPLAPAAFILILIGAMAKSAQFPFHFWLPNAMEAPTPVSAYLHSATMVKAGVYLLARLFPLFGSLPIWGNSVPLIGMITLTGGALLALGQTDLKRILAYTTVGALGGLVFLLGLGTPIAIKAMPVFLLAHALYKGCLFLVAGGIDHAVHNRNITELGGLSKAMPYTALAAVLSSLAMVGLPPFLGFIAKELSYESILTTGDPMLTVLAVIGFVAMAGVALWLGFAPFWAKPARQFHPHAETPPLYLPPLILALCGLLTGIAPQTTANMLIKPAVMAISPQVSTVKLTLWHGVTPYLLLSALTVLLAGAMYPLRHSLIALATRLWNKVRFLGPANLYNKALETILAFAAWQTRMLQSGYLRFYVLVIALTTIALTTYTAWTRLAGSFPLPAWTAPRFYDYVLTAIIIIAAITVTRTTSRLATIAMLGAIGYSIAILFMLYSAPDLSMVQFAIETLTVILFVLVIYRLPKFIQRTRRIPNVSDLIISLASGGLMTLLMLLVSSHASESTVSDFYSRNSLSNAYGRNIVNVILVDFRGLDTLGEITVLAIAAIGVLALIQLTLGDKETLSIPQRKIQKSILLESSALYMTPLLLIFSIFLLLRGHNKIGGGFVGGLVAASALMLYAIAISPDALRKLISIKPRLLVASGLFIALVSGLIGMLWGKPFMTGLWLPQTFAVIGKVGTPILFDVGVYLAVIGVVLWILLTFAKE
ncbi:MAG: Na+/H+ antiporter subunit B [Anaerolineae bacterium]|nr:Na+/H+ antiporter subunit B [Anaerolineae bacterium]